jgi:hypothetical protein
MLIARVFAAVLIAVSIAVLPAAGAAAILISHVEMTISQGPDAPPPCASHNCKDSIACALKCFNFVAAGPGPMPFPAYALDGAIPVCATAALHAYVSSPPTHPPPAD